MLKQVHLYHNMTPEPILEFEMWRCVNIILAVIKPYRVHTWNAAFEQMF